MDYKGQQYIESINDEVYMNSSKLGIEDEIFLTFTDSAILYF